MEMLKQAYHFSFGLIVDFSPLGDSKNQTVCQFLFVLFYPSA